MRKRIIRMLKQRGYSKNDINSVLDVLYESRVLKRPNYSQNFIDTLKKSILDEPDNSDRCVVNPDLPARRMKRKDGSGKGIGFNRMLNLLRRNINV